MSSCSFREERNMVWTTFLALNFVLCANFVSTQQFQLINPLNSKCDWIQNVTETESLAQHQYVALEDCLYYNLSAQANINFKKYGSLSSLPPTKEPGDKIAIDIFSTIMKSLYISDYVSPSLGGSVYMSWNDYRLQWQTSSWKLEALTIRSSAHVWVPDINSEKRESGLTDTITFQNITVTKTGTLGARLDFRIQGHCVTDYSRYPTDKISCCFDMKSNLYSKIIDYNVLNPNGIVNFDQAVTRWTVLDFKIKNGANDGGSSRLSICLLVNRQSTTLRMELMLPMAICAILVIISPLFGSMMHQIYVKMFSLLLQFLCFQFLVNRTPAAGFGDVVPKIYTFFEFTLATTMTSLVITLILRSCSNKDRKIPPPHKLELLSSAFNRHLCCVKNDITIENSNENQTNERNSSSWKEMFSAVNSFISLLLLVIYILAAIILGS